MLERRASIHFCLPGSAGAPPASHHPASCQPRTNHTPCQVYKVHGGPLGFMLSTNVAEADAQHAATLLRCARELLHVLGQASRAEVWGQWTRGLMRGCTPCGRLHLHGNRREAAALLPSSKDALVPADTPLAYRRCACRAGGPWA